MYSQTGLRKEETDLIIHKQLLDRIQETCLDFYCPEPRPPSKEERRTVILAKMPWMQVVDAIC